MTVKLTKCERGQEFSNLDLVGQLLGKKEQRKPPGIQVLGEESTLEDGDEELLEDIDFGVEVEAEDAYIGLNASYGFNGQYSGYFMHQEHRSMALLVSDVEKSTRTSRSRERTVKEDEKFDLEYYLMDLYEENPMLGQILEYKLENGAVDELSREEQEKLMRFPHKECESAVFEHTNTRLDK
jgi:protein SHQ1